MHVAALDRRPDLDDVDEEAISVFTFLSAQREVGFAALQPLCITDAISYIRFIPYYDREQQLEIFYRVFALERDYMRRQWERTSSAGA